VKRTDVDFIDSTFQIKHDKYANSMVKQHPKNILIHLQKKKCYMDEQGMKKS